MGVDQTGHDEFARLCAEVDELVFVVFQATQGDDAVDGRWLNVVLNPDDITIGPDGDQAPRECEVVCQRLWIDDGAIVEVDHDNVEQMRAG